MEKVPYEHSKHQQLWILMSNPYIVRNFVKEFRENQLPIIREPILLLKMMILYNYMGFRKAKHNKRKLESYCYPCEAAIQHLYKIHEIRPYYKCTVCPLNGLHCSDKNSLYTKANRLLIQLMKSGGCKSLFVKFCYMSQQIAFFPLNKEIVDKYYEVK